MCHKPPVQLYSEPLPNNWTLHLICKRELSQPSAGGFTSFFGLLPKAHDHRWGKEWWQIIKSAASASQHILCQSAGESPACEQHPENLNQSAHSSLFWLKTMVSVLEVLIFLPANSKSALVHPGGPWWCQKNHIICKEQRCGTEDTKGETLSTWLCLEILYIKFIIRICDKGQ